MSKKKFGLAAIVIFCTSLVSMNALAQREQLLEDKFWQQQEKAERQKQLEQEKALPAEKVVKERESSKSVSDLQAIIDNYAPDAFETEIGQTATVDADDNEGDAELERDHSAAIAPVQIEGVKDEKREEKDNPCKNASAMRELGCKTASGGVWIAKKTEKGVVYTFHKGKDGGKWILKQSKKGLKWTFKKAKSGFGGIFGFFKKIGKAFKNLGGGIKDRITGDRDEKVAQNAAKPASAPVVASVASPQLGEQSTGAAFDSDCWGDPAMSRAGLCPR